MTTKQADMSINAIPLDRNLTDKRLGHPEVKTFRTIVWCVDPDTDKKMIVDMLQMPRAFTWRNFNNFRNMWEQEGVQVTLEPVSE